MYIYLQENTTYIYQVIFFNMDERSKRIRNKTRRYISTDEEKYEYKKRKKNNNINVQETFDFIKKAIAAKYGEENFEKHCEQVSEASEDTTDEDEQREIIITEKEHIQQSSLPCKNQTILKSNIIPTNDEHSHTYNVQCTDMHKNKEGELSELQTCKNQNNIYQDFLHSNNSNEPLIPTLTYSCDESQNSNSTILSLNSSHTSQISPAISTLTIPSSKENTNYKQLYHDNSRESQNVCTIDQHESNTVDTRTLLLDFKNIIETGFKAMNDILGKQQQQLNEIKNHFKEKINANAIPKKPSYFPMKSQECLDRFDNIWINLFTELFYIHIFMNVK